MRRKHISFLLAAAAILIASASASASVMRLEVGDLVPKSNQIIRGEVVSVESAWGEWLTQGEVIYSTAIVRVTERYLGQPTQEVAVTLIGGTVNGTTMKASECPQLAPGEDVVLFLLEYEDKNWVTGLDNGKYRVVDDVAINNGHHTARRLPLTELEREIVDKVRDLSTDR
ncbi:MAG: hypothetical protein HKN21_08890 [Candidatus Eisenbacteria bacterium]|uniref:DUF5666 domain-containing protein n=1 Tax=Eiseniibacteriota bacterium TaxID=2212470 RepID=A0A7Y2EBP1_UNCEI|nr:hypothetical protein [Candidatus Eisenbacteria bacterium]